MSTKISIAAFTVIAAVFAAPEISNAKTHTHASGSYHHHRMVDSAYASAYGPARRYHPYHYRYYNTEVNRHYNNEVIFAGRYLGADPDPGVRLNLRVDRPDNR
jgi:hypothetical protein